MCRPLVEAMYKLSAKAVCRPLVEVTCRPAAKATRKPLAEVTCKPLADVTCDCDVADSSPMGLAVADPTSPTGLDGLLGAPTGLAQCSVSDSSPTGLAAAYTLPTGLGVLTSEPGSEWVVYCVSQWCCPPHPKRS